MEGGVRGTKLRLVLTGCDEVSIWKRHVKENVRYFRKEQMSNDLASVRVELATFPQGFSSHEKSSFPFSLRLPKDLLPSICHKSKKVKTLRGEVRYTLTAEMIHEDGNMMHTSRLLQLCQ